MSGKNRVGGTVFVKRNGVQYRAKGSWTWNPGRLKKTEVVGTDGVHGFIVNPQAPYIEGVITDHGNMSATDLIDTEDATITLELTNGKVFQLDEASYCEDGNITTAEGEIATKFVGMSGEEIRRN